MQQRQSGFSLVELVAVTVVVLVLTAIIAVNHTHTQSDIRDLKALDAVVALNQAETGLADYVKETENTLPGAMVVSTNTAYNSADPTARITFLVDCRFLGRTLSVAGLSVAHNGYRWVWQKT
ncbi:MAG: prepilin-type N-terminal cleavage/methylation domain-containing protein [Verrucomicrobiota bacterium]|jgi:prepilin-type N-terminal cleavage/methylation domain-containing protein